MKTSSWGGYTRSICIKKTHHMKITRTRTVGHRLTELDGTTERGWDKTLSITLSAALQCSSVLTWQKQSLVCLLWAHVQTYVQPVVLHVPTWAENPFLDMHENGAQRVNNATRTFRDFICEHCIYYFEVHNLLLFEVNYCQVPTQHPSSGQLASAVVSTWEKGRLLGDLDSYEKVVVV